MRSTLETMLPALRKAAFIPLTLIACQKGDKVPAYVEIPSVTLSTTTEQGGNSSKITDAWVFADEELVGVWELPAKVPVLRSGSSTITVTPAIKRNGFYDDRLRYPFYTSWSGTVEVEPKGSTVVQPVVEYMSQTLFWIEGFEDAGTQLNLTPASDTSLIIFDPIGHPDIVLDGTPCGGIILDQDHRYVRLYTDENFDVYGGPVFLEFDYRNDVVLTVGIQYLQGGVPRADPYLFLVPTRRDDGSMPWNKVYVDLSPVFNVGGITQRNFFFEVELPLSRNSGELYLDNIKLLRVLP
jgi:hypothetical protein